jgi:hypothetical protein
MLAIVALAFSGPKWLFAETSAERGRAGVFAVSAGWCALADLSAPHAGVVGFRTGDRHRPRHHLANELHADAQVGAWYALFFGATVPTLLLYGWLCRASVALAADRRHRARRPADDAAVFVTTRTARCRGVVMGCSTASPAAPVSISRSAPAPNACEG